jgi:hypothetical protein
MRCEMLQTARLDLHPFAMRARQNHGGRIFIVSQAAENLYLLAPHHIGGGAAHAHARQEEQRLPMIACNLDGPFGKILQASGRINIRRFNQGKLEKSYKITSKSLMIMQEILMIM